MAITASLLTNDTLVIQFDNEAPQHTRSDNPRWKEIVQAFRKGDEETLRSLISLKSIIEQYSVGQLSVSSTGVLWRGHPLHTLDAQRIMAYLRDGIPFRPIANYIEKKMKNPSARAIQEMYNFLEHQHMPLMDDGRFIAYKGVQKNYYSVYGNTNTVVISGIVDDQGKIYNEIGSIIEVERSSVDDDFRNACSNGLHVGSLKYATEWSDRVIYVAVDPKDVVSVPSDCDCQKLRCCKYEVLGEYTGPLPSHYTSEFSKKDEDLPEDNSDDDTNDDTPFDSDDECSHLNNEASDSDKDDEFPDESWIKGEVPSESDGELLSEEISDKISAIGEKILSIFSDIAAISVSELNVNTVCNKEMNYDKFVAFVLMIEKFFKIDYYHVEAQTFYFLPLRDFIEKVENEFANKVQDKDTYYKGVIHGLTDVNSHRSATYIKEDLGSGESHKHNSYIVGYLRGYGE